MEIADERHAHAALRKPVADMRHGLGRLVAIDRDAHQLGAGAAPARPPESTVAVDVGRIGVGHRLHDDGSAAANDARRPRRPRRFAPWRERSVAEPCMACAFAGDLSLTNPVPAFAQRPAAACSAATPSARLRTPRLSESGRRVHMTRTIDGPPGVSKVAERPRPATTLTAATRAVSIDHPLRRAGKRPGGDGRHDQKGHHEQDADDLHGDRDGHREQQRERRTHLAVDALGGGQLLVHAPSATAAARARHRPASTAPHRRRSRRCRPWSRRTRHRTGSRRDRPAAL